MDFQIKALNEEIFAGLFDLSDHALQARRARRLIVEAKPGVPCRVSMQDAKIGETVILVHYRHQPEESPFRASHAVYVREGAVQAQLDVNQVPDVIRSRLISLRFFDGDHMMINADVMPGDQLGEGISNAFEDSRIAYAHLHYAKPRCFPASVHRAV